MCGTARLRESINGSVLASKRISMVLENSKLMCKKAYGYVESVLERFSSLID